MAGSLVRRFPHRRSWFAGFLLGCILPLSQAPAFAQDDSPQAGVDEFLAESGADAAWEEGAVDVKARDAAVATLLGRAQDNGTVRVLVELGLGRAFRPEGLLPQTAAADQRAAIAAAQQSVAQQLAGLNAAVYADFKYLAGMAIEVDAHALQALAALPNVRSLQEDVPQPPALASSNPVIGSYTAWADGFSGVGVVAAVLDTGVDTSHPYFSLALGQKVVSQACYSTTSAAQGSTSVCPGGVAESTALGSGVNCDVAVFGCDHGTHVAGILAGNDGVGPNFGVAPDAKLIAVQVFSRFDGAACTSNSLPSPCALTFPSDQIKGLERVYDLRLLHQIASANMSLGGGQFFDQASCDAAKSLEKAAIDNLRAADIATVISAGNEGFTNSMGAPGCISSAVSVGATDDADNVASFSNIASFIDLLAPGVDITSSVPGGGIAPFNGTSMSAPQVAGAWAVLKQADPLASVNRVLAAFRNTGTSVNDNRPGGTVTDMRRINVDLALVGLGATGDPDAYEPDNNDTEATLLLPGLPQLHSIAPVGDTDWYRFDLSHQSALTLETSGSTGDTTMTLYILDTNGAVTPVEFNDDGGAGFHSLIDRQCGVDALPAGTWFVQINDFGDNGEIPAYTMSLTTAQCPDAYEPDGVSTQATLLEPGLPQVHNIVPVGDADWYTFAISFDSAVTLETTDSAGDTIMRLFDAGLAQIELNDDGGAGLLSLIDRQCGVDSLPAGTYFAQVNQFDNSQEILAYTLSLGTTVCGSDHDGDGIPDATDPDDDNDGVLDLSDDCPVGDTGWSSGPATDYDGDGCRDATEDNDDDNDGFPDSIDPNPLDPGVVPPASIGVWRPAIRLFYLDTSGNLAWDAGTDLVAPFGASTDLPVTGDWNGDGIDDIGIWRPAARRFFLDMDGNDVWEPATDLVVPFGATTDLPVTGDWNGDGIDDIGVWRPATRRFYLDTNGNYSWDPSTDLIVPFGISTDLPVIGDWNGDGIDDIGVWRPAIRLFYLDTNGNLTWDAGTDLVAPFGASTDLPVIGDWDGDRIDDIGIWRPGNYRFYLDTNGNYAWDVGIDLVAPFGTTTDLPLTGRW